MQKHLIHVYSIRHELLGDTHNPLNFSFALIYFIREANTLKSNQKWNPDNEFRTRLPVIQLIHVDCFYIPRPEVSGYRNQFTPNQCKAGHILEITHNSYYLNTFLCLVHAVIHTGKNKFYNPSDKISLKLVNVLRARGLAVR